MKTSSLKFRFILVFATFILVSCIVISIFAALSVIQTGKEFSSQQGKPVVEKAVSLIDGYKFEKLTQTLDPNDPWAEEVRLQLLSIKESVGCQYLFTMSEVAGKFLYIIDGSCDPSDTENYSSIGDDDDVSAWGKAPIEALTTGKTTSSGFVKQEGWGWKISTYKAIKNSSGATVGFVGCDFDLDSIIKNMRKKIILTSIIGLAFVILGALIVNIFSSSIFGTMKEISLAMEKISDGTADLTARIPVKADNELGVLAKNCNKVIENLASLVGELQKQTEVLGSTGKQLSQRMANHIENINATSGEVMSIDSQISLQQEKVENVASGVRVVETEIKNLEGRISDQTSAISQSSSAIEQISANIQSVGKTVDLITSDYENLVTQAHEGSKLVESVSDQIEEISKQSENLTEANAAIAAIAEQTNLLAMNAAIEAAHAGELGKGFSVVADEIRSLAETSATQSGAIKELLEGISLAISGIVESSKKSSESFITVGSKINQMDGLMKEVKSGMSEETTGVENILTTMRSLENTTREITTASAKMKNESAKVFDAVSDLERIATETHNKSAGITSSMEEMKAAANEAANASEVSLDAADNVVQMIHGFKLK